MTDLELIKKWMPELRIISQVFNFKFDHATKTSEREFVLTSDLAAELRKGIVRSSFGNQTDWDDNHEHNRVQQSAVEGLIIGIQPLKSKPVTAEEIATLFQQGGWSTEDAKSLLKRISEEKRSQG